MDIVMWKNHGEKSVKLPFVIYVDLGLQSKKVNCKKKEQFYTMKVNKQATCKSSVFIEFAQYESQNKH